MTDRKIYKPKPISGFPEWLPEYRAVEQTWMDTIRRVFESYGFCNIETPVVEELDVLLAKVGTDTQQEIYVLNRLNAEAEDREARLALHFDLTVPMARYVAQHFAHLSFPFKRYQMQRVYRGERPQKGRYREFYQCDIDVIGIDQVPLHFDAELPAVMVETYTALGVPPITIRLSNRKIVMGYLAGLGLTDVSNITRILDKRDKIGADKVEKMLVDIGLAAPQAQRCLALIDIKTPDASFADRVRALGVTNDLLSAGLDELTFVMNNLAHLPAGTVQVDLGIIRGLDYYTGTILEVYFQDMPEVGAIGSGGRYDDLAGTFINQKLPGVGVSIGLSRLLGLMIDRGLVLPGRKTPTDVLVVLPSDVQRASAAATAQTLRARGMNVELFHKPAKTGDQIAYANKKGIPYIWFPPFAAGDPHQVKNLATGEQVESTPDSWHAKDAAFS